MSAVASLPRPRQRLCNLPPPTQAAPRFRPAPRQRERAMADKRSHFRRLVLCRLHLCQTFQTASDDDGSWGECVLCGKRAGYVSRKALRRYGEAQELDGRALNRIRAPSPEREA